MEPIQSIRQIKGYYIQLNGTPKLLVYQGIEVLDIQETEQQLFLPHQKQLQKLIYASCNGYWDGNKILDNLKRYIKKIRI